MTVRTAVSRRLATAAAPSFLAIAALLVAAAVGPTALGAGGEEGDGEGR